MQLGFVLAPPSGVHHRQGLRQQVQSLVHLTHLPIRLGELGKNFRHAERCPRGPQGGQALTHLGDALRSLALRGQRPAPEERPQRHVARKPVLGRQGQQGLGVRLDRLPLPAQGMEVEHSSAAHPPG